MFTADGSTQLNGALQNGRAERFGALKFARYMGVVHDQWMQIAVAGMEHVDTAEAIFLLHLGDVSQHGRDLSSRNGSIHAVIVGRNPARGGKRGLSPCPK